MDPATIVRYNHDCRRRFADFFVDSVPWDVLVENQETSHQNIANAFMHGCNMEDWWLHFVLPGKAWSGPKYDGFTNAEAMRARVVEVERKTQEFLDGLRPQDLDRRYDVSAAGMGFASATLGDILVETALEDIHHRGEIMAMLWRRDIEPPYVSFAEWAAASTAAAR